MHAFDELIQYCTAFSLEAVSEAQLRVARALEFSSATSLIKSLQMVQLQRVISAVGMFSIFDAELQARMHAPDGFRAAEDALCGSGELELLQQFRDLQLAVNVLKHGRGRSYETLVARAESLPFRIKMPDGAYFSEGDVGEIGVLIDVDNEFVLACADMIRAVSKALQRGNDA